MMMTYTKIYLFLSVTFLTANLSASGVGVEFSEIVRDGQNKEIAAVRNIWEKYVELGGSDEAYAQFWNSYEKEACIGDIVKSYLGAGSSMYSNFKIETIDIKKTEDGYYEILSSASFEDNQVFVGAPMIFKVLASKADGEFKLCNYFYVSKTKLNRYQGAKIDYYYHQSYYFKENEARHADELVSTLADKYGIKLNRRISYILANNLDECNLHIGFTHSFLRSDYSYAGVAIHPNYILSGRTCHAHELVHGVFMPQFPNADKLFHEGVATYYGGASGESFEEQVVRFKEYISKNPINDYSDCESYHTMIDDRLNPFYVVGALLIEKALREKGEDAVKQLFKSKERFAALKEVFDVNEEVFHKFMEKVIRERI